MKSQVSKILNFLAKTTSVPGKLNNQVAKKTLGVTRLAARIHDIRNLGFTVYSNPRKVNGETVTFYRLATEQAKSAKRFAKAA